MRLVSVFLFIFIAACAQPPQDLQDGGKIYHVYFLGGQSNMEGYGRVGHLRGEHAQTHDAIRIFTGNPQGDNGENGGHGRWTALRPGFGQKFSASSERVKRSRYFGPEITFGLEMARLNPDQNIAIIKYARGGSSLAFDAPNFGTWSPDRETFGTDRVHEILASGRDQTAEGVLASIEQAVNEFTGGVPVEDDSTMIAVKLS